LALARLARPGRPKIVTFSGNFSGKTIPSLNVSRYGPQRSAILTGAFEPYSADVVFVDPLSPTAADDLRRVLDDPQVGLFWCELIQGTACVAIPDGLLQVVRDAKHRSDFLVGIDEVLTGVWRSADTFLFQQAVLPDVVDITALAKPLSDMTIPVAATLATAQVLDAARQTDPTVVVELENRYKNNLGAHIAWHALHTVNTPESQAQRRAEREILLRGLTELAASSPLVRSVEGFGAHVRLDVDSIFPFRENTLLAEMVGQSLEDLILRRCGVILGRCRFFPPLFPPQGSMSEVVERLRHGFDGLTVTRVYLNLVRNFASLGSFFVQRQISRSLDRVRKFVKRRSEARRQFS
jgi:acetylornithine/succinyldiaminopimelate/putrescine aminotransferase